MTIWLLEVSHALPGTVELVVAGGVTMPDVRFGEVPVPSNTILWAQSPKGGCSWAPGFLGSWVHIYWCRGTCVVSQALLLFSSSSVTLDQIIRP
jgi:hypothetical protein